MIYHFLMVVVESFWIFELFQKTSFHLNLYFEVSKDLYELVNPNLGIITGFSDLMTQIEVLRNMNLGQTPPALGINERTDES